MGAQRAIARDDVEGSNKYQNQSKHDMSKMDRL